MEDWMASLTGFLWMMVFLVKQDQLTRPYYFFSHNKTDRVGTEILDHIEGSLILEVALPERLALNQSYVP